jgi:ABC-type multidrug transport system fused ATPase/permease subunit
MEAIIQATKMVGIHDFISSLPNQYNEYVHERGATLSSGQRQLIAFARAILTNPRVLILDEATASVDTHAEEQIQKAIAVLMKNRTSIAIAHRLSTIQSADEILVLDKGQIIERGTHQQLIQAKGMYNKLYEMQLG